MKILLVVFLFSCSLALQFQGDQEQFTTWAENKAIEICWGEENTRKYLVEMKRAVAKCKQQDAPELELPPFRSSFKFVNMLMNSAEEMDQYKINKMFNFMKSFRGNQRGNYHKHSSSNQYDEFMEMMLKTQMMEMMENYMNANSNKNSNFGIPYSGKFGMWRNKRDAGDGIKDIELGDRLVAKINSYKESMVAEIGNMTCVLKEVGMLNVENQIDTQRMKQKLAEYNLPSEWFKNRFEELIDNCYEIATNLPANFMEENVVSGEFGEVNVGQVKYFLRCYGGQHEKLCMDQDTRNKIEENYGPVEDMLEQTGWTEYQLLNAFRYMITQELNEFF